MNYRTHPAPPRRSYQVDITLSPQQIETFYAGHVSQVSARDSTGVRLQFPLQSLREFVGHDGIRGTFRIEVTADNKLRTITRI